uniref:FBA_2 domain-containing protein n=1 Tax=Caenorhabditis tropicalis TaxID=1561998 RepID=A0A1I7THA9_9PELO
MIKLKLPCYSLDFFISDSLTLTIALNENHRLLIELTDIPELTGIFVGDEEWEYTWLIPEQSIKEVLDHFTRLFCKKQIDSLQVFCDTNEFELSLVKEELKGVQFRALLIMCPSNDEDIKAAMDILPYPGVLVLVDEQATKKEIDRKLAIQNFDSLDAWCPLDELLMINSPRIQINASHWKNKDLNRFLKLWIRGAMKNLLYITMTHKDGWNLKAVLEGIIVQESDFLWGNLDIQREDGVVGVVVLDQLPNIIKLYA